MRALCAGLGGGARRKAAAGERGAGAAAGASQDLRGLKQRTEKKSIFACSCASQDDAQQRLTLTQPPLEVEDSNVLPPPRLLKKKNLLFLFPCLSDARPEPREKSLSPGLPGLLQAGPGGRQAILRLLLLLIFLLLLLLRHRPRPAPALPHPLAAAHGAAQIQRRANPAPRKSSAAQIQRRANPARSKSSAAQIQRRANPAQSKSSAEQIHSNPGAARHSAASAPQWQNLGNFRAVPAAGSFPVPGRSRGEVTCLVLQGLVHGSDCHKAGESMSQPAKKIYVQYTSICGQHEKSSCDRKTKDKEGMREKPPKDAKV
ncbi:uncharacterized protein LOC104692848 [Corvus cornix cornix]|uniref:uncharacterized protein LOC104692848 n=1 Tax=Corvus cornix cornix TaxID=932674 RepID=UPI00194FE267|nr:uncharacterized protein LOC104692848 [Corvus cornix cornix]